MNAGIPFLRGQSHQYDSRIEFHFTMCNYGIHIYEAHNSLSTCESFKTNASDASVNSMCCLPAFHQGVALELHSFGVNMLSNLCSNAINQQVIWLRYN